MGPLTYVMGLATVEETRDGADLCCIGSEVPKLLFPDGEDPMGKEVVVKGRKFKVIGVMVEKGMMGFETITFVPYDRRLIDTDLLTPSERAHVDAYHAEVGRQIAPLLKGADRDWLESATAPL